MACRISPIRLHWGLMAVLAAAGSCTNAGSDAPACPTAPACLLDGAADSVSPRPTSISGVAQKGPFVRGTRVTVQELDDRLMPVGHTFEVETNDDLGAFAVPV